MSKDNCRKQPANVSVACVHQTDADTMGMIDILALRYCIASWGGDVRPDKPAMGSLAASAKQKRWGATQVAMS